MDYSRDLALVSELRLCNRCMEREGLSVENGRCSICNGLMDRIDEIVELVKDAVKDYEFKTFQLGATLDASILEAEDEIRSRLKIKGRRSIKSDLVSSISKRLAALYNARPVYVDADIYIHLDLKSRSVSVRGRSISLYGKYKKYERGIEQKKSLCNNCNGRGCNTCNFKGSSIISIEEIISNNLLRLYAADQLRFAWIGGEDEDSLVLGARPFFVKIINPRIRSIRYDEIFIKEHGVEVWFTNIATRFPDKVIPFKSRFSILVYTDESIEMDPSITIDTVRLADGRIKRIHDFRVKVIDEHTLEIEMVADGGLAIKKFIEGGTEPNISSLFKKRMKCRYFDVLDVEVC